MEDTPKIKGIIYELCSLNTDIIDSYIGSTENLNSRLKIKNQFILT